MDLHDSAKQVEPASHRWETRRGKWRLEIAGNTWCHCFLCAKPSHRAFHRIGD